MEKPAEEFKKNIRRLLILAFALCTICPCIFAKPVSWSYLHSLRFRQSQKTVFTESDNSFYVEIEHVTPDSIQVAVNSLPQNASFVSYKKETVLLQDSGSGSFSNGTRITIWMKFSAAGTYRISPVDIVINGGFYQIPFEPVTVMENPRLIQPEISISFSSRKIRASMPAKVSPGSFAEASAGEHIVFTVSIRYADAVRNVHWNIPEDSVFKKIRSYDFSEAVSHESYSSEFHPVAEFDWQPLKEGVFAFPEIFVTAAAYNGIVSDVKCEAPSFKVRMAAPESREKKHESPFSYAFIEPSHFEETASAPDAESQDILRLLELHRAERNSLPFVSSAARQRKKLESQLELAPSGHEPSIVLFFLALILSVAFLALSSVFFVLKRKKLHAACASFFIVSAVFVLLYGFRVYGKHGIYTGGKICPIPEKNAPSSVTIPAGSVVSIMRTAGGWRYIQYNDACGWVPLETVLSVN